MKFCITNAHFIPSRGGFSYYLSKEFSKMGIDVVVISSDINMFKNTKYKVGWKDYENFRIYRTKTNFYFHQAPFVKIKKELIKEISPDFVYTTEYFQPISLSASKVCEKLNIPFFFNQHAYKYPDGLFGVAFKFYDKLIRDSVWKRTKSAMALSDAARDFLLGIGFSKKIDVITGGVDTKKFKPVKGTLRDRLDIDKDTFLVLCVARLIPEKGVLKIPVFAEATEDLDIRYVIVGKGELKEKLNRMLEGAKNVDVIDFIPHEKLPGIYSDADLYIVPSNVEVLNFSVMEAVACGLPVLASDVGGMSGLINEEIGFLLPKDDLDVWVQKIREFYFKKITLDKKSIVNYSEKFDWKNVSKKVLKVVTSND